MDEDFHSTINDLVEFSRMHYAYEESVLRGCAFHLLEEHVTEHREDMAKILDFIHNSLSGTVNKVSLADYALAWWKNHVLISDMQYRSMVLAKGSD